MTVLEWPASSPDFNIIENIWAKFSRSVYANIKQYRNVIQLKFVMNVMNWNLLKQKRIKKLFKSISNRLLDVFQRKGGFTKY